MIDSKISKKSNFLTSVEKVKEARYRAVTIRKSILNMSFEASTPHIGSSLSCVDILAACYTLFGAEYLCDDSIFLLSKGHGAPALYATLREFDVLNDDDLQGFGRAGSVLEEHPNHLIPGVVHPSGSLGHGLGFAAGFVLAGKALGAKRSATVVLSDGECNEGTVWEAALFAGGKSLSGLIAIVDRNGLQATGSTSETYGQIDLADSFESFGWSTMTVDGHDSAQILSALSEARLNNDGPVCIIADTVKGNGVSFMENDNNWHYRKLDAETFEMAQLALAANSK